MTSINNHPLYYTHPFRYFAPLHAAQDVGLDEQNHQLHLRIEIVYPILYGYKTVNENKNETSQLEFDQYIMQTYNSSQLEQCNNMEIECITLSTLLMFCRGLSSILQPLRRSCWGTEENILVACTIWLPLTNRARDTFGCL